MKDLAYPISCYDLIIQKTLDKYIHSSIYIICNGWFLSYILISPFFLQSPRGQIVINSLTAIVAIPSWLW